VNLTCLKTDKKYVLKLKKEETYLVTRRLMKDIL